MEKIIIQNKIENSDLINSSECKEILNSLRLLSNELQRKYPQDWNEFLNILMENY